MSKQNEQSILTIIHKTRYKLTEVYASEREAKKHVLNINFGLFFIKYFPFILHRHKSLGTATLKLPVFL